MPRHNMPDASAFKFRAVLSAMFFSIVIIAYQNCAQGPSRIVETDGSANRKITVLGKISDANKNIFLDHDSLSENGPISYEIDLKKKLVKKRFYEIPESDPTGNIATCSINDVWIQTLDLLFKSTEVCFYDVQENSNLICTQEYIYPHTIFHYKNATFKLGENAKPCNDHHNVCEDKLDLYLVTARDFINDHKNCQ